MSSSTTSGLSRSTASRAGDAVNLAHRLEASWITAHSASNWIMRVRAGGSSSTTRTLSIVLFPPPPRSTGIFMVNSNRSVACASPPSLRGRRSRRDARVCSTDPSGCLRVVVARGAIGLLTKISSLNPFCFTLTMNRHARPRSRRRSGSRFRSSVAAAAVALLPWDGMPRFPSALPGCPRARFARFLRSCGRARSRRLKGHQFARIAHDRAE